MRTRSLAILAVLGLAFLGCGDDDGGSQSLDDNLYVNPVSPVGSVGGYVKDGLIHEGLSGARVRVKSGSFEASVTTDGSGFYSVDGVPAGGEVLVIIDAPGFLSAEVTGRLGNSAGNFPVDNATLTFAPIGLLPDTGSFGLWIYDDAGRPASGVTLTLNAWTRFFQYFDGYPSERGTTAVNATSDAGGRVLFLGLPDFLQLGTRISDYVVVGVPPVDSDGDGIYEFPGGRYGYNVLAHGSADPTIVMETGGLYPGDLWVEASNVQWLEGYATNAYSPGSIAPTGPIYVLFNQPIDPDTVAVSVYDEYGEDPLTGTSAPVTAVNGRSLTITFPTALDVGAEYNMLIHASTVVGDLDVARDFYAPFFVVNTAIPAGSIQASLRRTDPLDPTNPQVILTFSEPVGFGLPGVPLSWDNCVIFYQIYNLGGGPLVGDDPGELGSGSCAYELYPWEPGPLLPPGAGYSGYTTRWAFNLAAIYAPADPDPPLVPAGTAIHLVFDSVSDVAYRMKRVTGEPLSTLVVHVPTL